MTILGSKSTVGEEERGFVAGLSSSAQTLESVIAEIAPTEIPILFVGESGTGKEVLANRVHQLSTHREEPFRKISCATINPANLAGELGLNSSQKAGPARSSAGTVFLDEIGELDIACQRNLLHALPDGDTGPHPGLLSGRVVSATSRNLEHEMRAGHFRNDLYYRINGICIRIPPLRERKEDIPGLVEWFLTKHATQLGRLRPSLSPRTLQLFLDYSWPGNIRELENVVKKIVVLGDERLAMGDWETVPAEARVMEVTTARDCPLKTAARMAARAAERELILEALARTHWNRKRAAQELQISYKSLLYKLKQIAVEDSRSN